MRFSTSSLLALIPLVSATYCPSINGMKIVWQETFIGCQGCSPNLKDWSIALDIDTNEEHQTYTSSNTNLQLSGGETLQIVPWKSPSGEWTSGRIETHQSFTPQPGKKMRMQAKIRMGNAANKQGIWPAFWMLGDAMRHGTDWPLCGELDIFEQIDGDMAAYGTVHCQTDNGGVCNEPVGRQAHTAMPDNHFHSWAIVIDRTSGNWETESITWLMDGEPFNSLTGAQLGDQGTWSTLAHSPMYILLNVAVGGNWPGPPNAATDDGYGSMMEVQYVAVYESL
ncbi:hypothetical protein G7046_g7438 [Stylonectria norvegica]|nr:hypothetical protein G7046_g7438 [Stylonectria norvegica]